MINWKGNEFAFFTDIINLMAVSDIIVIGSVVTDLLLYFRREKPLRISLFPFLCYREVQTIASHF